MSSGSLYIHSFLPHSHSDYRTVNLRLIYYCKTSYFLKTDLTNLFHLLNYTPITFLFHWHFNPSLKEYAPTNKLWNTAPYVLSKSKGSDGDRKWEQRKVTVFVASLVSRSGYPQPLSNQGEIVMGSQGRRKYKFDNYFCFLQLLISWLTMKLF